VDTAAEEEGEEGEEEKEEEEDEEEGGESRMSGIVAVVEGRVVARSIECGLVSWLVKSGAHKSSSYPESRLFRIELRQLTIPLWAR